MLDVWCSESLLRSVEGDPWRTGRRGVQDLQPALRLRYGLNIRQEYRASSVPGPLIGKLIDRHPVLPWRTSGLLRVGTTGYSVSVLETGK